MIFFLILCGGETSKGNVHGFLARFYGKTEVTDWNTHTHTRRRVIFLLVNKFFFPTFTFVLILFFNTILSFSNFFLYDESVLSQGGLAHTLRHNKQLYKRLRSNLYYANSTLTRILSQPRVEKDLIATKTPIQYHLFPLHFQARIHEQSRTRSHIHCNSRVLRGVGFWARV